MLLCLSLAYGCLPSAAVFVYMYCVSVYARLRMVHSQWFVHPCMRNARMVSRALTQLFLFPCVRISMFKSLLASSGTFQPFILAPVFSTCHPLTLSPTGQAAGASGGAEVFRWLLWTRCFRGRHVMDFFDR